MQVTWRCWRLVKAVPLYVPAFGNAPSHGYIREVSLLGMRGNEGSGSLTMQEGNPSSTPFANHYHDRYAETHNDITWLHWGWPLL